MNEPEPRPDPADERPVTAGVVRRRRRTALIGACSAVALAGTAGAVHAGLSTSPPAVGLVAAAGSPAPGDGGSDAHLGDLDGRAEADGSGTDGHPGRSGEDHGGNPAADRRPGPDGASVGFAAGDHPDDDRAAGDGGGPGRPRTATTPLAAAPAPPGPAGPNPYLPPVSTTRPDPGTQPAPTTGWTTTSTVDTTTSVPQTTTTARGTTSSEHW